MTRKSRYPLPVVCRADDRGVVHHVLEPHNLALASPALCEMTVDNMFIVCRGPLLEFPTCLRCLVDTKGEIR